MKKNVLFLFFLKLFCGNKYTKIKKKEKLDVKLNFGEEIFLYMQNILVCLIDQSLIKFYVFFPLFCAFNKKYFSDIEVYGRLLKLC